MFLLAATAPRLWSDRATTEATEEPGDAKLRRRRILCTVLTHTVMYVDVTLWAKCVCRGNTVLKEVLYWPSLSVSPYAESFVPEILHTRRRYAYTRTDLTSISDGVESAEDGRRSPIEWADYLHELSRATFAVVDISIRTSDTYDGSYFWDTPDHCMYAFLHRMTTRAVWKLAIFDPDYSHFLRTAHGHKIKRALKIGRLILGCIDGGVPPECVRSLLPVQPSKRVKLYQGLNINRCFGIGICSKAMPLQLMVTAYSVLKQLETKSTNGTELLSTMLRACRSVKRNKDVLEDTISALLLDASVAPFSGQETLRAYLREILRLDLHADGQTTAAQILPRRSKKASYFPLQSVNQRAAALYAARTYRTYPASDRPHHSSYVTEDPPESATTPPESVQSRVVRRRVAVEPAWNSARAGSERRKEKDRKADKGS